MQVVDVEARGAIEAVVLASTEPVPPALLAQLVELPTARVEELCDELAVEYEREGRGFQLARVAGGYRFQTHPDAYAYVERFVLEGQTARLSGLRRWATPELPKNAHIHLLLGAGAGHGLRVVGRERKAGLAR